MNDPIIVTKNSINKLTTALALTHKKFRVVVLEHTARYEKIGAGIQLSPNTFHTFDKLKLKDTARSIAVFIDKLQLMDATTAEKITHVDLTKRFRERFGNPYAMVHRNDLHSILVKTYQTKTNIELRTDNDVVSYTQDRSHASALLTSNKQINNQTLINADGLQSHVQQQMVNDKPPQITKHTTYRSVIPTEQMPEDLRWNATTL